MAFKSLGRATLKLWAAIGLPSSKAWIKAGRQELRDPRTRMIAETMETHKETLEQLSKD